MGHARRVSGLLGLALAVGGQRPGVLPPDAAAAAKEAPVEEHARGRAEAAPVGLPAHEVLGATASPDGMSWCRVIVALGARASHSDLRSLWAALRKRQTADWARFTCSFYLPDMNPFDDSWVDVNELTIIETVPPAPPTPEPEEPPEPEVFWESEACILSFDGGDCELVIVEPLKQARWSGDGRFFWIHYTDPRDLESRCVRIEAPYEWTPPPPCASASFR